GHLWDAAGNLLAVATFTDETASGWQQVSFSPPVAIQADTTYVASYYAPNGHYAFDAADFGIGVDRGGLHALSDTAAGGNGVFVNGVGGGFPTNSFNAANYWVDVVFSNALDTTAPAVTSTTPADAATGVEPGTAVAATFGEAVLPATIGFELR